MEFGTKKAKKALISQTENAIAPVKAAADASPSKLTSSSMALMDTIGEVTQGMATREQLQAVVDQSKPVPPGNFDATEIRDVYKPEALIGAEILSAIPVKDWQDIEKQGSGFSIETKQISHSFWEVARGLDNVRNLRILRYLHEYCHQRWRWFIMLHLWYHAYSCRARRRHNIDYYTVWHMSSSWSS